MKHLYMISGTMGVGKTTVCQILKQKLSNSVFLDGDWCWDMSPFQVTPETRRMVLENITFLLNRFLGCSVYDHIIFCWVMHQQEIMDGILAGLDLSGCQVHKVSLICTREALVKRLKKDIDNGVRMEDAIGKSVERIPLYGSLDTVKIDTSFLPPDQVAEAVVAVEENQ